MEAGGKVQAGRSVETINLQTLMTQCAQNIESRVGLKGVGLPLGKERVGYSAPCFWGAQQYLVLE